MQARETPSPSLAAQCVGAAGYLSVLIAPGLLILSCVRHLPYLAVGSVLLVFPLLRSVFGVVPAGLRPNLDVRIAHILDRLGVLYCIVLLVSVAALLARLNGSPFGFREGVGWALSLWATLVFGTCVSHQLLHHKAKPQRLLGHLLAGITGYPILGYEHSRHHNLPGNTSAAEWPRANESAWRFGWRRVNAIFPETLGGKGLLIAGNAKSPTVRGLRAAVIATCAMVGLFTFAAGWKGTVVYAVASSLVAVTIQVITYVQHWGLGDDVLRDARTAAYSWESDCQFQAWLTLDLSMHQAHHDDGALPHYRLGLSPASPRLPAGYLFLMFVAFVPPLWRKVMTPALEYWKAHPRAPLSAGRRLACAAFYH